MWHQERQRKLQIFPDLVLVCSNVLSLGAAYVIQSVAITN